MKLPIANDKFILIGYKDKEAGKKLQDIAKSMKMNLIGAPVPFYVFRRKLFST